MSHAQPVSSAQISKKPKTTRAQWIDTTRGIAVFFVIYHHVLLFIQHNIGLSVPRWLLLFDDFLILFRMPALCLVSGIFLYKKVYEPADKYWVNRVARLGYLYIVWSLFYALMQVVLVSVRTETNLTTELLHWAKVTLMLHSELWYFFALMLFYAYWRLTLKIPKSIQFPVLLTIYFLYATDIIKTSSWGWDHCLHYLIYFMIGAWYGTKILNVVPKVSVFQGITLTAVFFASFIVYAIWGFRTYFPWAEAFVGPIALAWFIWLCDQIDKINGINKLTRYLGFRTLPVYALHMVILDFVTRATLVVFGLQFSKLEYLLLPWGISIMVTLICLFIWKMTYKVAPFMYDLPRRFYR
ncbi:acyltransferase family protein [Rothia sp. P13129]|uniref:acyltransferase family protein n=1 Tax=Rothia sp. P13129 TaxID=3402664 RepID=UPI003AD56C85